MLILWKNISTEACIMFSSRHSIPSGSDMIHTFTQFIFKRIYHRYSFRTTWNQTSHSNLCDLPLGKNINGKYLFCPQTFSNCHRIDNAAQKNRLYHYFTFLVINSDYFKIINALWLVDTMWQLRSGSTLAHIMTCFLMTCIFLGQMEEEAWPDLWPNPSVSS